jgi:hypothetical protein
MPAVADSKQVSKSADPWDAPDPAARGACGVAGIRPPEYSGYGGEYTDPEGTHHRVGSPLAT